MRKSSTEYFYFMSSQIIFLAIFTGILLFWDSFNWFYGALFIIYLVFFLFPIIHLVYMLRNTNKTSFFVEEKVEKSFNSKKYLWYILLFGLPYIVNNISWLENLFSSYLKFYYLPYALLTMLTLYFVFRNDFYEYWVFENILFVNILKFKIFEIKNKQKNKKIVFTRKRIKKSQIIQIKHIMGGLYYH